MLTWSFSRRANQSASTEAIDGRSEAVSGIELVSPAGWMDFGSLPHPQGRRQEPRALRRAAGESRSLAVRFQLHSSLAGPRRGGPAAVGLAPTVCPAGRRQDGIMSSCCPRVCGSVKNANSTDSSRFVALCTLLNCSFARCWPPLVSS